MWQLDYGIRIPSGAVVNRERRSGGNQDLIAKSALYQEWE